MKIQLRYQELKTGQLREVAYRLPLAIGRVFEKMPQEINGNPAGRMVLDDDTASGYHALIENVGGSIVITDQNSGNGTFVNNNRITQATLANGDRLQIGQHQITVSFIAASSPAPTIRTQTVIGFNPSTGLPDPNPPSAPVNPNFPPPAFLAARQVTLEELKSTGWLQEGDDRFEYAAVGAGLGSYIWADYLRIYGARAHQIVAIGTQEKPYGKYSQLCKNSQIPLHERLRSNSDSCPDNIWGWPSYALREAWRDFCRGKIFSAVSLLWRVFAEPTFAETYTPRSGNVFKSIDREAKRIDWNLMYRYGSVKAIRKTNDGRYAIAYSKGKGEYGFVVARYVHLATGYPAIRFLPHLEEYRDKTRDIKSVVSAYEPHDHIYEYLAKNGGTVLIQGRGIVASRVIQRLYEVRQNCRRNVEIIHLMRRPLTQGYRFGWGERAVKNNWEFQPFNWPKACWGGDLREILEKASPEERVKLTNNWAGTTTADRRDWQRITKTGLQEKWYKIKYGEVKRVEKSGEKVKYDYIEKEDGKELGLTTREVNFIIDATGLDAEVKSSPLLKDLIEHHRLPLLENQRIAVTNDFEIKEMRNGSGRMYAAGVMTLGGPNAAVDSFLGLQYCALRSADDLTKNKAARLRYLNGFSSLVEWCKWITNQSP